MKLTLFHFMRPLHLREMDPPTGIMDICGFDIETIIWVRMLSGRSGTIGSWLPLSD